MPKSNRLIDLVPETIQGIKEFTAYAENQIKRNLLDNKRLENLLVECDRRLNQKCKPLQGEKNDRQQTGSTAGTDESEGRERYARAWTIRIITGTWMA